MLQCRCPSCTPIFSKSHIACFRARRFLRPPWACRARMATLWRMRSPFVATWLTWPTKARTPLRPARRQSGSGLSTSPNLVVSGFEVGPDLRLVREDDGLKSVVLDKAIDVAEHLANWLLHRSRSSKISSRSRGLAKSLVRFDLWHRVVQGATFVLGEVHPDRAFRQCTGDSTGDPHAT